MTKAIVFVLVAIIAAAGFYFWKNNKTNFSSVPLVGKVQQSAPAASLDPMAMESLRSRSYPATLSIEQQLADGSNYHKYLASYQSDGLKIYGLLTVPIENQNQQKPKNGWPAILFNHGYLNPQTYETDPSVGQYASYYPFFSENGYIVFKPDYRGNGNSQGQPEGSYYSAAYTIDDLNALSALKKFGGVNPDKVGIWGHSMGGNITLKDLVVRPNDIKAAVIWGGVVGTYDDLLYHWNNTRFRPGPYEMSLRVRNRSTLLSKYGTPQQNPNFWHSIDPNYFVQDITAPVQLDVGGADEEVPVAFSLQLRDRLKSVGKTVEYFEYPGDDHNISQNVNTAMQHSLDFFNKYLK